MPLGTTVMRRVSLALAAACAIGTAYVAHADSGTVHHCAIDGLGPAEVYLDTNGRRVTFDVLGKRYEAKARDGRFKLRADGRAYSFDPRWRTPPAELTITTANESRVVRCSGP